MTFLQVVNIIRDTALAQPNVNTVVREFLDLNREDTKYSAVVIQDRDGLRDRIVEQDWNTYTFHLGYVDRLTFDESNRDDIFSTGINVINNIVSSIRERWDLEVSIIDRFSTFNQRFTASCAGVYVVLAIQVPISDCVDTEETNIYDKLSIDITDNGHYHYVPDADGRPYGDIDIVVNVENQKPEDSLDETITSNGIYNYVPEEGRVFNEVDITVDVPGKPEESLVDTITSNGSYHYAPEEGRVFNDVDITVAVSAAKPEESLVETISSNGSYHYDPSAGSVFSGADITVDVHPSNSLSRTYTTNGSKTITGEFNGGVITVAVPSDQKPEQVGRFEVTDWGTSYVFYPDSGYVFSEVEVMNATPVRTYTSTVVSNGSLRWEAGEGESLVSMLDINVNVHPSQSLVESITSNGSYHYTGEWNGADITVAVSAAKPEESLVETITSNGSYHYDPSVGSVFSGVDISVDVHPSSALSKTYTTNGTKTITGEFNGGTVTISVHPSTSLSRTYTENGTYNVNGEWKNAEITVAVPVKTETSLAETITSNGSYHYDPAAGSVFSGADISVDVHPSSALSKTYTTNGTKTITGEFNGGSVTINVHPSAALSKTYTTNGTKTITGEFNGGKVNVDVHPSQSLIQSISSNGVTSLSGEWKDAEITVAVPTTLTVTKTQAQYDALTVKDSNTIYLIYG